MIPIPVVGEAIVIVRVASDRLAADIRDAVKRGMDRAAPDIDKEGEAAGKRMADGMNRGVRENRDKVGKELEVYARRFVSGVDGIFDDGGRRIGQRFGDSIAAGIRKNEGKTRDSVDRSVSRALALRSGGAVDKIGHDLGTRFTRAVGEGIGEGGIGKELAIRDTGLERQGQDTGRRFGRAIGAGFSDVGDDIWDDVRRAFHMRPGDIDDDGRFAAFRFADGVDNGFKSRFRRLFDAGRQAASNMGDGMQRGFIRAQVRAEETGKNIGDRFQRGFGKARNESRKFFDSLTPGFDIINRRASTAGNNIGNNIGRGVNRKRSALFKIFSGLGSDLGKHFNLGIGAAKMGEAIISILATAGPSLLSGAAALGTALASEIIVGMAALGPGIAGALGVGLAAVSTLGLNLGLLKLAFSGSSASAKAFKKQLTGFKELLTASFSPGVVSGFSDMISTLQAKLLPAINGLLTKTGVAMGNVARGFADTVTSAGNLSRIKGILSTNIGFLNNFKAGLSGLTTSFLILFNASKPFVDFIGAGIKRFGEWAAASLAVSEANGGLADWMQGMLDSFKDLWAIVKNFSKGFANIFAAAAPAGESLLGSIRGIAERFRAWTSDSGNMKRMEAFFTKAHTLASKVFDMLGAIFTAGGKAFEGMDLGPILHVLDTLEKVIAPAIARIFKQIQTGASANLVKTFDNIGTAITKIADSGSFQKVAGFMSSIFEKISELAASDFGSTILAWVIPIGLLGGAVTALLGPLFTLGKGLFLLVDLMPAISAPALAVVAAIAAVAAAFVVMWNNSEKLRDAIGKLVKDVGGTLTEIWDKLAPKIQTVWEKFQTLAGVIGDRLAPVIEFLAPIVQRVFNFIGDTLGNVIDVIGGFIDILIGIFTGDWGKIWDGVKEVFGAAWAQILNSLGFIKDMLSAAWDAITAIIYNVGQVIYGVVTTAWSGISSWLSTTWDTIKQSAIDHWNGIWQFFEDILKQIWTAFTTVWDTIYGWLVERFTAIDAAVRAKWDGIWQFFEDILGQIKQGIIIAFTAVVDWLSTAWDRVKAEVVSHWNGIFAFFEGIWEQITTAFHVAVDAVSGWLSEQWDKIKTSISGAWEGVSATVGRVWDSISTAITDPIEAAWKTVTDWIRKIGEAVSGIIDTVTTAFTTVTGLVGSILAAQQTAISTTLNTPGAPLSGLGPHLKGILDAPIPALARGGIIPAVPGGMLVRAGEAGRAERVDPIQRNGLTARDEALIRMLTTQLAGVGGAGNDVNVNVSLGERSLEAFVTSVIKRNDDRNARRVGRVRPT